MTLIGEFSLEKVANALDISIKIPTENGDNASLYYYHNTIIHGSLQYLDIINRTRLILIPDVKHVSSHVTISDV